MANNDAPFGLRLVRSKGSGYTSGGVQTFKVLGTDAVIIRPGDPVVRTGTADSFGMPVVAKATAGTGNKITGVMVANVPYKDIPVLRDNPGFREASTQQYISVISDPAATFEVQVKGTLLAANNGLNINFVDDTPTLANAWSSVEADQSTVAAGATLQLKILSVVQNPDNEQGANSIIEVSINNHTEAANTAGI